MPEPLDEDGSIAGFVDDDRLDDSVGGRRTEDDVVRPVFCLGCQSPSCRYLQDGPPSFASPNLLVPSVSTAGSLLSLTSRGNSRCCQISRNVRKAYRRSAAK